MPTIRSLLDRGLTGNTTSVPGFFVGATWESFATGVTPAKHGIYCWEQLRPGSYEQVRHYTHDNFKVPAFWDHVSRAGHRVAVLDVPLCPYSKDLNGIQLIEWGAHDAQYGFMTWPPELAEDVVAKFGEHPCRGSCDASRGPADFVAFRDALVRGIGTKADLTRHFLEQGDWDIFMQVFTESHCIGHQAWHLHDPRHPWHKPEEARVTGDPVKDVYLAIDRAMGEILRDVDEDTTVVFLAGHGMGPKFQAQFLLERILLGLGVAAPLPAPVPPPLRWRDRLDPLLGRAWQRLPQGLRSALKPLRGNVRSWIDGPPKSPPPLIDPAASRCFMVSNNFAHGAIRINLVGREPQGKVQPGAECDALCDELTRELGRIVNLDTGRPVVRRVIRTRDEYAGPHLGLLPDLLIEWTNDAPVYRIGSDRIGELRGEYRYCRSGDHHPGGMFIGVGPGIAHGRLDRTVSILDFAPTLGAMLGVEIPDADGRCIPELWGLTRSGPFPSRPEQRSTS
jgi:predicted AlkP superfamily phosphohydrolase/phosphomutase